MVSRINTIEGPIRGTWGSDPRILVYKGIPYAKPPIGERRWQKPEPMDAWEEERICDTYKPMAMQDQPGSDPLEFWTKEIHPTGTEFPRSEDCLYLNVFSPARNGNEKLPVLFYIHGGGYQGGYPYEIEFDWEHVARKGIVVVAPAYRLGIMGFFAHPGLCGSDGKAGNYGIGDLLEALRWTNRNIDRFGGDPSRITVAGQSAGAGAVQLLLSMPETKGMIAGAIMESGVSIGFRDMPRNDDSLTKALSMGAAFLENAGLTLEEARETPWEVLREREKTILGDGFHFTPVIGGNYLRMDAQEAWIRNAMHAVPVLCGYNRDELVLLSRMFGEFPENLEELRDFARQYAEQSEMFLELCGVKTDADVPKLFDRPCFTGLSAGTRRFGEIQSRQNRTAYLYEFQERVPGDDSPGAYHGAEMWFAYDSLARCHRPFEGKHYDLARTVSSYWANFIKTGDPNGSDIFGNPLPQWRPYKTEDPFLLAIKQHIEPVEKLDRFEQNILDFRIAFSGVGESEK